jgi:hypothetical protein
MHDIYPGQAMWDADATMLPLSLRTSDDATWALHDSNLTHARKNSNAPV